MKNGDIISTSANNIASKLIRFATKSDFSHVMLYVGYSSCIHAMPDGGVQTINLQRLMFNDVNDVSVFRLKDPVEKKVIDDICTYARAQWKTSYSKLDAARSPFGVGGLTNRQYCSKLIALSYDAANIKLTENPNYCTPENIISSEKLIKIPNVIREATVEEINFSKTNSPIDEQTLVADKILDDIRKITRKDIQNFNQIDEYLKENSEYDEEITAIVRDSGYCDMWRNEMSKNKWRYSISDVSYVINDEKMTREFCENEIEMSVQQLKQFTLMREFYRWSHSKFHLSYFKLLFDLYENLVAMMSKRLGVFGAVILEK
ncbi:hypothetical protein NKW84_18115 [Acetobacter senegalensis]|uniref:YiiX/YebB-like N1pC/P60 family cysteine hydrolase n=1 Tax=Acetobacter TaxID=434 RepID=UPI00159442EC|nr:MULTISPECIES: YiiX/YebB-like N1pC/P60 family cysteine hydrolase [Acetobacter]MCP1197738.1 hypothetical protein [Acetobacter senegalensis]